MNLKKKFRPSIQTNPKYFTKKKKNTCNTRQKYKLEILNLKLYSNTLVTYLALDTLLNELMKLPSTLIE